MRNTVTERMSLLKNDRFQTNARASQREVALVGKRASDDHRSLERTKRRDQRSVSRPDRWMYRIAACAPPHRVKTILMLGVVFLFYIVS